MGSMADFWELRDLQLKKTRGLKSKGREEATREAETKKNL